MILDINKNIGYSLGNKNSKDRSSTLNWNGWKNDRDF